MTVAIVVQPEAEADIGEAFRWYEARQPGLGGELIIELDRVFGQIAANPLRPRPRYRETRLVKLRRFPYMAAYAVREDTAFVLAVLHERRSPALLLSRARGLQEDG